MSDDEIGRAHSIVGEHTGRIDGAFAHRCVVCDGGARRAHLRRVAEARKVLAVQPCEERARRGVERADFERAAAVARLGAPKLGAPSATAGVELLRAGA